MSEYVPNYPKTYLQFRRGVTYYYRFEETARKKRVLGREMRKFWKQQYQFWVSGNRGIDCSDATCCIMTTEMQHMRR